MVFTNHTDAENAINAKAPLIRSVNVAGNTGATETVPDVDGQINVYTLDANCTFTFPTPAAGKNFEVHLIQDGTGSRTATWPAAVKWVNSITAPTLTVTASRRDTFAFVATDGTNWLGYFTGANFSA